MNVRASLGLMLFWFLVAGTPRPLSAQELDVHDLLSEDSLHLSSLVVARVGPVTITAREFFFNYVFGPSFAKRRPDSKRRHLEFMINEKLLALGAEAEGRANDARLKANLAALEGDVATEELFRDDLLRRVRVSDQEIDRAVRQENVSVRLRWLYAKERTEAEKSSHGLRSGVPFDTLFEDQFAGRNVARDDRMMQSTMFRLHRRNQALAAAVESLAVGLPSIPVQAPDGWYIVQVDSLWVRSLATESADAKARDDARRALTQMKSDSLSDLYVRRMMLDADPVIQRRTFDILRAYLGTTRLTDARFEDWDLAGRFRNENDSVDYRHPEKYAALILVKLRQGKITLGDFLMWYRLREANLSFRLDSPQAFFVSLEDVVWRMVRDGLLVNRAINRGLNTRQNVATQKQWWRDKLLYQLAKDSLRRTITWTDSTLQAYLQQHPRSFTDGSGAPRSYDRVKEDVLREWYEKELTERIVRDLARLRRVFPTTVNEQNLLRVPVDIENDPRAIEVYSVKKGGTFPHPAFPTIDSFWQSWQ
jgi:hypothetical protein